MKIALDLDGVLGDFVGATAKLLNFDPRVVTCWDYYPKIGTTESAFWKSIQAQGSQFWEDIAPYPWYAMLHRTCKRTAQAVVLTSPIDDPACHFGKASWLKRHLFLKPGDYLIGAAKEFCATPRTVLIDDSDKNCATFIEHGGRAILFPRPWNLNRSLSDSAVEYTLEKLAEMESELK